MTRKILFPALCLICFRGIASAQESTYSADSLMTAFDNGSKISLKGTEITFTDVIAETKKSRVVFKSSGKHKVICELSSPTDNGNAKLLVGSPLTVVGRVRGRGILGNVTLDDCSLALSDRTRDPSEVIGEAPVTPEASAQQSEGPIEDLTEDPTEIPPETRNIDAITRIAAPISSKRTSPTERVPEPRPITIAIPADRLSPQVIERPNEVTGKTSNLTNALLPVVLYASSALLVGLALLALVKSRPALIPTRLRTSPNGAVTPEIRRAALEALLLKQKKKKWWKT